MKLPRNNWMIIGVAFGLWLLSWFFMMAFAHDPTIGNDGYYVWTASKAALPLAAAVCMYGLAIRSAAARDRSKLAVHLTYIAILGLLIPTMWGGMQGSLHAHDAPMGAIVDAACVAALIYGAAIFWVFRGIELGARKLWRRHDAA
jgi:hypothetical protein